ncbi:MAG TPA: hypothetical protein VK457_04820, partial [Chloroflexota bacterium]|nr:hypothetical protein [Chloroflexota bacterium]
APSRNEVLTNVRRWRDAFVENSHSFGQEAFRPALKDDFGLWSVCEGRWGRGSGFRDAVVQEVSQWFDDTARKRLHRRVELQIQKAWTDQVVRPFEALFNEPSV